jgi:hypothetical protein
VPRRPNSELHPLRRAVPGPEPRTGSGPGPARPRMLIAAPCGIEDYFHPINIASTDDQRHRIGERYGIPVGPR